MQKEKDFLKKKKLTNKELTQAIMELKQDLMGFRQDITTNDKNIRFIAEKAFLNEGVLNLLLEHDKEFNKIVIEKAKEFEKSKSADKEGA